MYPLTWRGGVPTDLEGIPTDLEGDVSARSRLLMLWERRFSSLARSTGNRSCSTLNESGLSLESESAPSNLQQGES